MRFRSSTAALLLAACAVGCGAESPAPIEQVSMTASLAQNRVSMADRKVEVSITNGFSFAIQLTGATFRNRLFPGDTHPFRLGIVRPGRQLDLVFTLPSAACAEIAPAEPTIALSYVSNGMSSAATVPIADPFAVLDGIRQTDCARADIESLANISIADRLDISIQAGKPIAHLELLLTPHPNPGEGSSDRAILTVVELERTTLLTPAGTATWRPVGLTTASHQPVSATLEVIPARCDAHALAEDKRGTYLGTHVTIDGRLLPMIYLEIPQRTKGLIYDYVNSYCQR